MTTCVFCRNHSLDYEHSKCEQEWKRRVNSGLCERCGDRPGPPSYECCSCDAKGPFLNYHDGSV